MSTEIPAEKSRWLRTDAHNRGQNRHVFFLRCEPARVGEVEFTMAHYRNEVSGRAGSMPLSEFLRPSNFVPAPEDVAPPEPAQLTLPTVDPNAAPLAQLHQKADLILALLGYKAAA